jgi:competence protein ComEC
MLGAGKIFLGCTDLAQDESPSDPLKIHVLNVGQGSAILLEQEGRFALFDAGPDSIGLADTLFKRGVKRLDWVLVSHWHRDHAGGLLDLNNSHDPRPEVGEILTGSDTGGVWIRDSVKSLAHRWGTSFREIQRSDAWNFGDAWHCRVLWPPAYLRLGGNNASVVLQVDDGLFSALFMGDLEHEGEEALLKLSPTLHADFLQVGHHGSSQSSSLPFLAQIAPTQAVISVGKGNTYGHPTHSTLRKLSLVLGDSAQIFRTDQQGSLFWEWAFQIGIWKR